MKVVCANCQKHLGDKPGEGISHGLCEECVNELYPWMKTKEGGSNGFRNDEQKAV